jgi:hypothetical protein
MAKDIYPDDYKPKQNGGPSFNKAMNPPNNPKKDKQPTSYNRNADYPSYGKKGNPSTGGH